MWDVVLKKWGLTLNIKHWEFMYLWASELLWYKTIFKTDLKGVVMSHTVCHLVSVPEIRHSAGWTTGQSIREMKFIFIIVF